VLLGQYQVRVDVKGRIALPKRLREEIGKALIVTQGYENCLIIVSQKQWEKLIGEILAEPFSSGVGRDTRRFLLGGAFEVSLDSQGRFVIPPPLREYAGIRGEVICLGIGHYLEIWDTQRWDEYQQYLDEHIEKIAEKLREA
jgi:MraZ protein